jgi:predicted 2-oxoglutarate/Fe(II)-dependent dioxygenase YbiX/peroxiredoxin
MLLPGDSAPYFRAASSVNPKFNFDTVAGRYVVISFLGSSQIPSSRQFLDEIGRRSERFDVTNAIFFGVTNDPDDAQRLKHEDNGRVYFYDLDLEVSRRFSVLAETSNSAEAPSSDPFTLTRKTFVLDHSMRVIGIIGMKDDDVPRQVETIFALIDSLPKLSAITTTAPVLIVPYVFEPAFCRRLIDYYGAKGGEDSGFMNDVNGKTVGIIDYSHKRRMDCEITDQALIGAAQERIKRRIVPAIKQSYQFDVTRIERHIVACYDAAQGAHFRAHRDNTTLGTAHRRFAVTINLNSPDYEGGEIWFPEFGRKKWKADSGAAIVFSCSLLHEVPKVTKGKRYAFLPFLYDDAAASVRERNRQFVSDQIQASRGNTSNLCESTTKSNFSKIRIDGSAGCGHPEGCETCLTSPAYQLGVPPVNASRSQQSIVKV